MALKFRPISRGDLASLIADLNISKVTSSDIAEVGSTVISADIFKNYNTDLNPDKKEVPAEYTKLGYIDLAIPIINPFLAGVHHSAWKIASGLESKEVDAIINYQCVYDLETNEFMYLDQFTRDIQFDCERFLYGAACLRYLIEKRNFRTAVEEQTYNHYVTKIAKILNVDRKAIPSSAIYEVQADEIKKIAAGKVPGVYYVDKRYVVNTNLIEGFEERDSELFTHIVDEIEDIEQSEAAEKIIKFDKLNILSILRDNGVKTLTDQIMTYMFILPYGYRQTIDGRHDKLTYAYSDLIKENTDVNNIMLRKNVTIGVVMDKCRRLYNNICYVMLGRGLNKQDDTYKSLVDTLKGKEGLIRGRMEGSRYDYTARTVITCDPEMPITKVGIPIKILEKVAEPAVINYFRRSNNEKWKKRGNMSTFSRATNDTAFGVSYIDVLKEMFKNQTIYGLIGRQPTLFYLGIQGFEIVPVEGNAIVLSPLIVMPFNADFDGDQMHFTLPVTKAGIDDVCNKMLFKDNMWYPKNGQCTVEIRHEIHYGIWACIDEDFLTRIGTNAQKYNKMSPSDVFDAVINHAVNVYDYVGDERAGTIALRYAMYGNTKEAVVLPKKIKPSSFTKAIMGKCNSTKAFTDAINRVVKLGFAVAKIYPPDISIIVEGDTLQKGIRAMVDEFNKDMQERYKYVKLGIELYDSYVIEFSKQSAKLNKRIEKYLDEELPFFNGYRLMVKSGAKGNMGNLMQLFGVKGVIQKPDNTSFTMLIEGNYTTRLTGMEHFITGYGSRKGIADKVLATAEPGYLSRKLEHSAPNIRITTEDCGTTEGLEFYPEDIIPFIDPSVLSPDGPTPYPLNGTELTDEDIRVFYKKYSNQSQFVQAVDYIATFLHGRVVFDDRTEDGLRYIKTDADASDYINYMWGTYKEYAEGTRTKARPVKMRSPLKCKKPCCALCYGKDLTHDIIGQAQLETDSQDAKLYSEKYPNGFDRRNATREEILEHDDLKRKITQASKKSVRFDNVLFPQVGDKVGFIAAQSIGEPGTQLTMKNFQKGGVAGAKNLTSSFETIEKLFDMVDFGKSDTKINGMITHNPISPVTGFVKGINIGSGRKQIIVTPTPESNENLMGNKKLFIVPEQTKLKPYVKKGDSIIRIQGNISMYESLRYRGYEDTVKSLVLCTYNIFRQSDVNIIHFEIIATAMSCGYAMNTPANSRFKEGDIVSLEEAGNNNVEIIPTLVGIKSLPAYKVDFLESMAMENLTTYVPRAILTSPTDSMSNPIIRTMFGLDMNKEA